MTPGVGGAPGGALRRLSLRRRGGLLHRGDRPGPVARPGPGQRSERGQATAELALVLPLVGLLLLVVVQVALVARDQVLVVHAAREAVREAAVDPAPGSARRGALRSSPLDPARLRVVTTHSGDEGATVTVEVRYEAVTRVPLAGRLLPDVALRASAAMRAEW